MKLLNIKHSLRFKLIIGFVTVAVPLVALLLYNNYYASNTIREQVADSNKNSMILYSHQIEAALNKETNFLYNIALEDPNIVAFSQLREHTDEYYLAKARILNTLTRYHRFDKSVDLQFIYSVNKQDLFHTPIKTSSYEELESIQTTIEKLVKSVRPESEYFREWKAVEYGPDRFALIRLVDAGDGFYLGAFVQLENLMIPLDLIHLEDGFAGFVNRQGELITNAAAIGRHRLDISLASEANEVYQVVRKDDRKYVVVMNPIQGTDVILSAFVPESQMLKNLYHFRRVIVLISIAALITLIIYLVYLNDILLKPLNNLVRGMRRIKHGDWETRLHSSKAKEFAIINETFNGMAAEIHDLKISVYEEQIKAHKAELKHLQLQINPHFLLNSINIVYNLAEIKNYGVIQLMCMNLVKYFRFTTKTHQVAVTIAEEMEHMESYIKIQQVRFPERITYAFHIAEQAQKAAIPPLLIQPFIENAIKYGFDFMDHPFHIGIEVRFIGSDQLEIVIQDNGNGFSADVLSQLQSGGLKANRDGQHLGISNVQYRLKHIFGQKASLEFDNAPDGGARIRIILPFRTVEQFTSY
ncbi:cache domain-containing sensor histidine kinase [Paenibacillus cookii]|uniref:Sensor histidine kinase n=1 Tax=Paenibacillus cookii TaxID=157839 RepID=A0ABQ4LZ05_9BACL|nr:histidine kinase [Paenibacillus cookii]GIO68515.1 sensor histidine kinase [Paenibacillus cookii]